MEQEIEIGSNDLFKLFKIHVTELNLGVADMQRVYTIKAENLHQASKKLFKYLCNFYEDRLSMWPANEGDNFFTATFQRNGGTLQLKWIEK